jgi:hypothetical protein
VVSVLASPQNMFTGLQAFGLTLVLGLLTEAGRRLLARRRPVDSRT